MNSETPVSKLSNKLSFLGLSVSHHIVIFLSLLLTLGAYFISEKQVKANSADQFEFQSQQLVDLVKERMERYEEALWAGVAALKMFPSDASRTDWRRFQEGFSLDERFPGINGIGVIHYVPEEKLPTYLSWQRELKSDYSIHPEHSEPEYWPITYIEPESTNQKAVGLDMAHELSRFTAAQRARSSKSATITGPITLVQDTKKTPGFLFYAPWYSNQSNNNAYGDSDGGFKGLVYAPFIMNKLMDGTLENINRLVNFSIHDGETLLYSELLNNVDNADPNPLFVKRVSLNMYGRTWEFELHSTQLFRTQQDHAQPLVILVGGIIIDVLLLAVFMILSRSKKHAVHYADRVTASLKRRKEELEDVSKNLEKKNQELVEANRELDQFAFVASHDLKAPLRGIGQLALWIEEDSEGQLTEMTQDHLNLMKSRIVRLERLLDDLLAYSRVGRTDNSVQKVKINELVMNIFNLFEHDKRFSMKLDSPEGEFNTMTTPLELVLRNLISNAMKHHDKENGNINILVQKTDDRNLTFTVSDDGPGIPPEHHKKVFELFHTLKPRDKVEGSGLGLSIIKKTLDRYHCTYEIQSDGQHGMTFVFTWPIGDTEDD